MSRGQGRVYRPKVRGAETGVWWIDYSMHGTRHRESSETTSKAEAQRLLRQKIGDREAGKIVGRPERVFLAVYEDDLEGKRQLVGGLRWLHETQYDLDGLRSKDRAQQLWNHLEKFWPAPTAVTAVTETRLDEYSAHRLAQGAARQTVNNELSALRAGFNLAIKKKLIAIAPTFELPKVHNAREGFFEDGDLALVLNELPEYARRIITFLRITGWREGEALDLTWDRVDFERKGISLSEQHTKGKKGRLFPFGVAPDLKAILDKCCQDRDGSDPYVFNGPKGKGRCHEQTLQKVWKGATKRAGVTRIIHDLRRTAARDFIDAGVDRADVKLLCGWNTDSVFERYLVRNNADLERAVAKRYGKLPANSEAVSPA
jgi:integrase